MEHSEVIIIRGTIQSYMIITRETAIESSQISMNFFLSIIRKTEVREKHISLTSARLKNFWTSYGKWNVCSQSFIESGSTIRFVYR